jgi:hypothetical protein
VLPSDVEHVLLCWRKRFQLPLGHRFGALMRELFAGEPRLADFKAPWPLERALLAEERPNPHFTEARS